MCVGSKSDQYTSLRCRELAVCRLPFAVWLRVMDVRGIGFNGREIHRSSYIVTDWIGGVYYTSLDLYTLDS